MFHKQSGAALVVSISLLAIGLMLGVSSFQSARLEESMAGNQRFAASAQMAAEAGASDILSDRAKYLSEQVASGGLSSCPSGWDELEEDLIPANGYLHID